MTDQLLPCPFCGKQPRYVIGCYVDTQGNDWPFAECDPCHVGAPVEFWNTRAQPADCEQKPAAFCVRSPATNKTKLYKGSKAHLIPSFENAGYQITLLFTHPAPAVVLLPEPLLFAQSVQQQTYVMGWNACREETARLNGVQP